MIKKRPHFLLLLLLLTPMHYAGAANTLDVSLEQGQLLLTPKHGGDGSAWGLPQCDSCHVLNSIHGNAPVIRNIVRSKGYRTCAGCHGSNGTELVRECKICHNSTDLPEAPVQLGTKNHNFDIGAKERLKDENCLVCHVSSDMDGRFENNTDLTLFPDKSANKSGYSTQSEFCLRCHNRTHQQPGFNIARSDPNHPQIAMEKHYRSIDVHGQRQGSGTGTYSGLRGGYQYKSTVECTDCHAMHGTHNDQLIIGSSDSGVFKLSSNLRLKPYKINVTRSNYSQLCVLCHKMNNPVGEANIDTGNGLSGVHLTSSIQNCTDCHAHGKGKEDLMVNTTDVSLDEGKLLLTPRHGRNGDGSAWGQPDCDNCHAVSLIHDNAPAIRQIVRDKGYPSCTGCHGNNGTNRERQCIICHNPQDLPYAPLQADAKNHNFDVSEISPLNDEDCLQCHDSSDMDTNWEINIDLTLIPDKAGRKAEYLHSSEFCIRCHNRDHQQPGFEMTGLDFRHPLIAMEDNYRFIDMHGLPKGSGERTYAGMRDDNYRYGTVVDCIDCHAMHGTHNDKLIINSSETGAFKLDEHFRFTPYLVDVHAGDYSQLCVLCHKMDAIVEDVDLDTGNGLSGVHMTASDCRTCHTHGQAVQTGL